jgi:hypothetical protein
MLSVRLNGFHGNAEQLRHVFIGKAATDQSRDFRFAFRELNVFTCVKM